MKTFIQSIILVLYGWRIHKTVYRTIDNNGKSITGYYLMYYKKGYFTGYGYRYHELDLAWYKQFDKSAGKKLLGDMVAWGLILWFIGWTIYAINKS